ncbi:MAG: PA domain-containing protein, partial [Pseudomonadota bacterium]
PDQIPNTLAGNIALIQRGNRDGIPFYFYQKIALVQQAGAIGAIIYNSEPGDFGGTLVTPEDWVPVVSISQENGGLLLSKLPTSVTIVNQMIETESFYDFMSGTSMSAGFVSGAVGLLRAHAPQKSGVDIKNILLSTTDPIASAQGNLVSGGQLNLFKALSTLPLPGDLNKDYTLRIIDTVTGLKILSGQSADGISQDFPHWDSDGDGKAGLPESTQVLQKSQF